MPTHGQGAQGYRRLGHQLVGVVVYDGEQHLLSVQLFFSDFNRDNLVPYGIRLALERPRRRPRR